MNDPNRRAFLKAALAAGCACAWGRRGIAQTPARGCSLVMVAPSRISAARSNGIGVVGKELSSTTGDAQRDQALGLALVRISQLFGERPGFGFIDDSGSPNAYATDETMVAGTWGTVLMGRTLFEDLLRRFDDSGIAILAVLAHEFGHIAQFRRRIFDTLIGGSPTRKRAELHADFLAGYFLGLRKLQNESLRLRTAGLALYRIGDYAFNDKDHHGTPDERVAAAEAGFKFAADRRGFSAVCKDGMNWILATHKA